MPLVCLQEVIPNLVVVSCARNPRMWTVSLKHRLYGGLGSAARGFSCHIFVFWYESVAFQGYFLSCESKVPPGSLQPPGPTECGVLCGAWPCTGRARSRWLWGPWLSRRETPVGMQEEWGNSGTQRLGYISHPNFLVGRQAMNEVLRMREPVTQHRNQWTGVVCRTHQPSM